MDADCRGTKVPGRAGADNSPAEVKAALMLSVVLSGVVISAVGPQRPCERSFV